MDFGGKFSNWKCLKSLQSRRGFTHRCFSKKSMIFDKNPWFLTKINNFWQKSMIFEIFKIPSRLYSAFLLQKIDDFWQKSMIFDKNQWFLIKIPWLARGPGEIKDFEIIFSHAGQYQKVPQRNIKFPNIKTWLLLHICVCVCVLFTFLSSFEFNMFVRLPIFLGHVSIFKRCLATQL